MERPGRIPGRIDAALSLCRHLHRKRQHHLHASACGDPASRQTGDAAAGNGTKETPQPPDAVPESRKRQHRHETVPPPQLEIDETSPEQPAIGWLGSSRSAGNARALAECVRAVDQRHGGTGTSETLPSPTKAAKPEKFRCRCRRLLSH